MAGKTPADTLRTPQNSGAATGGEAVNLTSDYDPSAGGYAQNSTRGVWVGGAGSLKVDMVMAGGAAGVGLVIPGIAAGTLLPICVTKIYSTANGTTATNVVAFF